MEINWEFSEGASEREIAKLISSVEIQLPDAYLNLLRKHNGGEGDLSLEPVWLQLWSIDEVIDTCHAKSFVEYPGFFFFASNGGLESLAFKIEDENCIEIFMFDPIEGVSSGIKIANNFAEFEEAIGKEYQD